MNGGRGLVIAACTLLSLSASAADAPWARASARSDDFTVLLVLAPDPVAVAKMWAKPTPPRLDEYRTAEVGTTVTAMLVYSGGKAGPGGNCDLVYRIAIRHEDGSTPVEAAPSPLCSKHVPGPPGAQMLGESAAGIVTDGDPRRVTVVATVTDRVTGKSVEVEAPLELVAAGTLFHFESVRSLEDMQTQIRQRFALDAERAAVRRTFVTHGRATLYEHPTQRGVEKYVYDIDLCSYYVWRWNVSADFDERGLLRQAYVNGEVVFPDGTPKRGVPKVASPGKKASISRVIRTRPEAYKGESSLYYLVFDGDSDPATLDDRAAVGAGPTRPDPIDSGTLHVYGDVDPWRSIFDTDSAEPIAQYPGGCEKADARYGSDPAARRNNPTRDVVDRMIKAMNATQPPPASGAPR